MHVPVISHPSQKTPVHLLENHKIGPATVRNQKLERENNARRPRSDLSEIEDEKEYWVMYGGFILRRISLYRRP